MKALLHTACELALRVSQVWAVIAGICVGAPTAHAYRTAGDLPEFEGTEKVRWEEPLIRYSVYGEPPFGVLLDESLRIIEDAFDTWTEPDCSQIVFWQDGITATAASPGDRRNTVEWVHTGWGTRGFEHSAAAVADVQYVKKDDQWQIDEVDLYINADSQSWSFSGTLSTETRDLYTVMVHEAGHMLGLMHPCEDPLTPVEGVPECTPAGNFNVTMHPAYSVTRNMLADDDIEGVCFLYPGQSCEVVGCPPGQECTEVGCRMPCGDALCAPGEACVEGACQEVDFTPCTGGECPNCGVDDDCERGQVCIELRCQEGSRRFGDPCGEDTDCDEGICTEDGACSASCMSAYDCPEGWTCEQDEALCQTELRPFGAECEEANQCVGNQCLAKLSRDPLCTRECGAGHPKCPLGWSCDEVDDRKVCTPPQKDKGCGCETPGKRSPGARQSLLSPLFLLALAACVSRRRRASTSIGTK